MNETIDIDKKLVELIIHIKTCLTSETIEPIIKIEKCLAYIRTFENDKR